ncbi:hypothetical protein RM648_11860 [Mammaliicoccus sciuri]|uniref:hypothetical protein n=1 Tax=Mammaliicoccus sciuri TaxID=1296 RepID=UPI0018C9FCBE|nr:hypothetical protein [Mammaliicoccus sciuri]MBG9211163.1 hypothetical protein [Mammaliicoccus sciuri]MDT0745964.1 hypothetical protein [Mammaliicoccus sciuri]MDT0753319.1 hypothetical protein [Mammaliicoccus sciuri]WQL34131.1 hypothetical protein P3U41_04880 [Mammaliicoccus sciuri]WQL61071.1 hypothetical protein P3T96_04880 [Mammaliicoccus sciuri]
MKNLKLLITEFTFIFIVGINYYLFENHNLMTFFLFNIILPTLLVVISNLILSNKKRYKAMIVLLNTFVLQFLLNYSIILNSCMFEKIIENTKNIFGENGSVEISIQESSLAQYSFTYILLVVLTLGVSYLLEFIKMKRNGG